MTLWQALGVVVGVYAIYAAIQGKVFAKQGPWGRYIERAESPGYFWAVIAVYAGLSVALFTVF